MSINELNSLLKTVKKSFLSGRLSFSAAERISSPLIEKVNTKRNEISLISGVPLDSITFIEYLRY